MSIYDLRDYYKRMEAQAAFLWMNQTVRLEQMASYAAWDYYRLQYEHFNNLCQKAIS